MASDLLCRLKSEDNDPVSPHNGQDVTISVEEEGAVDKAHKKRVNGYHAVNVTDDRDSTPGSIAGQSTFDAVNDTFGDADDPTDSLEVYKQIRSEIDEIRSNIDAVTKLRDDFNLSDSQKQYVEYLSLSLSPFCRIPNKMTFDFD